MKILIILLLLCSSVNACEICGCSASNSGLGILPNFENHFVGLRYKYSPFKTIHPDNNSTSSEYFNNLELWGRFVPVKNLQIFASVPFVINTQNESNNINFVRDFGDPSLLVNYMFIKKNIDSQGIWRHLLQAGGGLKFPAGKYNIVENQHTLLPNMQPGSGAFDYTLNALYVLRFRKIGINLDFNYRFTTTNDLEYKLGNRSLISSRMFYVKTFKNSLTLLPHLGVDYDFSGNDLSYLQVVKYTGNSSFSSSLGLDVFHENISFGINVQIPVSQTINSGYTTNPFRVSTQLIYFFKSIKNNKICQL